MELPQYDAIVIGSGPNGLAAAITLAQAGLKVVIYEGRESIGGGMRSAELTLPGYTHDICSAIHPLAVTSPFFSTLPLHNFGLEWVYSPAALAHPFDDGTSALLWPSIEETSHYFGEDGRAYQKLVGPLVKKWHKLKADVLGPLHFPRYPLCYAQFGGRAIQSASGLGRRRFQGERARGFFAGLAGHSMLPLDQLMTAGFGLVLALHGHLSGWPMVKGGSCKLAEALSAYFRFLGGEIVTGFTVKNIDALPPCKVLLCDLGPKQLLEIAGHQLTPSYKRELERFRYGPGIFKIDWALSHPIPWGDKECFQAATLHIGGSSSEIKQSEQEVWEGKHPNKPFVILAQQSLFDPLRAPLGKQTAWGYCHVPNNSTVDMTDQIEQQIERFAPGFRDCILARSTKTAQEVENYNPNYQGGDINGGSQDWRQCFSRPTSFFSPYATSSKSIFLCSSSTPPGGGVHGMCGYHAALAAHKKILST